MKITKDTKASIPKNALVKMTQMNHITHIQYMEKRNDRVNIKKLDKDRYVHLATGEIKEFNHIETRKDSYNSLKQTFGKVSDLINNNFKGQPNEFHVTLTYKDNVTDTKRLYSDFKRFMTRLKRKYQDKSTIDYMSVVEPQERGAWHCHVLLRFNDVPKLFVSNNLIRELWGQGKIVSTKSLKNIDNIGVYLTACVFYSVITGQSPVGNPANTSVGFDNPDKIELLDYDIVKSLQMFAWQTIQDYLQKGEFQVLLVNGVEK